MPRGQRKFYTEPVTVLPPPKNPTRVHHGGSMLKLAKFYFKPFGQVDVFTPTRFRYQEKNMSPCGTPLPGMREYFFSLAFPSKRLWQWTKESPVPPDNVSPVPPLA